MYHASFLSLPSFPAPKEKKIRLIAGYACVTIFSVFFKQFSFKSYRTYSLHSRINAAFPCSVFHSFFSENFTIERWWFSDVRNVKKKKWGVADFVLERTCPEEQLNLSKSRFVSEEGHSGWKSKILQLELWREMFFAKYGLNGPIKRI